MATKIVTKNSSTASAVPTASDLVQGELAVNVADKRLFTEDNAGAIVELGTNPSALTVTGEITANGGIALGDNDKATFGASDDLQIYHDGSNSRIVDAGTGIMTIQASSQLGIYNADGTQVSAEFVNDGKVGLRFNGSEKLTTTSTGIDVTGTATMDGLTMASGSQSVIGVFGTSGLQMIGVTGGDNVIGTMGANEPLVLRTGSTEAARIDASQRLLVGISAAVTSTTNTSDGVTFAKAYTWTHVSDAGGQYVQRQNAGGFSTFYQGTTNVGSIGVEGSDLTIGTGDTGLQFRDASDAIRPFNTTTNSARDASIDLGRSSERFRDLYLSGTATMGGLTATNNGITLQSGSVTKSAISVAASTNQGINGTSAGDQYNWTNGGKMLWSTNNGANAHLVLDSSGNVGIGVTPSAAYKMQVAVATNTVSTGSPVASSLFSIQGGTTTVGDGVSLQLTNTSGAKETGWRLSAVTTSGNNGDLVFNGYAGGSDYPERMRLTAAGNLLVGTTTSLGRITVTATGSTPIDCARTETSLANQIIFRNGNGAVGTIQTSGSSTAYNTSSDQRLKDNIVDAPSASDDIDAIQVRSFDWKADGEHQKYGMIAQELQTVAPEAVSGDADSEDMMGVDYSKLVPMLVKEIQSLRNRVAQLEE